MPAKGAMTPAALQSRRSLFRRRVTVALLNVLTLIALGFGVAQVFGTDGWSTADVLIFGAFLVGAPWTVMGFWNAVIGLWLLHGTMDGLTRAAPHMAAAPPVPTQRTAVLMFLRNEDPERALSRLLEVRRSLNASGMGHLYDVFVLSDSSEPDIIEAEAETFERFHDALGPNARYRRRAENTGWKAGNIRDFVERWGDGYTFFLPLDSDSLMSGDSVLRMQGMMEANPKLGILQSLVVGTPASSAFARIFQFGMRHGMRSFTIGAAWWHGDCGPYWGHNALIRLAPFRDQCALPVLPGNGPLGGHILSHDQVEAALMRRAGYEVRVLPVEGESWEDNPVTLLDFTRRDLRWCQGNMQYWPILRWKNLEPMSRFQVFAAIAMYFGSPAWMVMTFAAASKLFEDGALDINFSLAISMFFIMFAVSLFPKVAGWIDIALRPGGAAAYGGRLRFAAGALAETLFSIILAPAVAFRVTLFLIGLLFGKRVIWGGQVRDAYRLTWRDAAVGLWPQTLAGTGLVALIAIMAPSGLPWAAPVLSGLVFAIPFAVLTASAGFGRVCQRIGLCAIPDEIDTHQSLQAIAKTPILADIRVTPVAAE